jgi:hypothetical protein
MTGNYFSSTKHRYRLQTVTPKGQYEGVRYCFKCACRQTASMSRWEFWGGKWIL